MSTVNKSIIIGYLGADPELRHTKDKKAVVNFNIATAETWNNKTGEKQQKTEWHRIVAWGNLAEICGKYLKKGAHIYVEGKLTTEEWVDKQDIKRWTTKIVISEMRMLDSRQDSSDKSKSTHKEYDEEMVTEKLLDERMDADMATEEGDELPF